MSLKKENGENLNVDLIGMGADGDWILNPMNLDDTKLREKSAIDLWNNYIKNPANDYAMSDAQYVEVISNGEYYGLYLLQRRVDAKYLQLDKDTDLLFKGAPTWVAYSVYDGYRVVHLPYELEQTYMTLYESLNTIDVNNYVDGDSAKPRHIDTYL